MSRPRFDDWPSHPRLASMMEPFLPVGVWNADQETKDFGSDPVSLAQAS